MTIREAVLAFAAPIEINSSTLDLELINSGFNGEDEYTTSIEVETARSAVNILSSMLMIDRFSEGDLTIDYDVAGIQKRLLFLATKYGFHDIVDEDKPKVQDKSYLW